MDELAAQKPRRTVFVKLERDSSVPKCFADYVLRGCRLEDALKRKQSAAKRKRLKSRLKRH